MLLANISIPLLGIIDTAILGHLNNSKYLSSVALGAHFMSLLFWSFGFLRMGTTGFTARAKGENNLQSMNNVLLQSLSIGMICAALLLLLYPLFSELAIRWLTPHNSPIATLALEYSNIRIWGAVPALLLYSITGWLIGKQHTKAAMTVLVSLNVINIILDYVLIVIFDMHVRGAATATLIAEYSALMIAVYIILAHHKIRPTAKELFIVLQFNMLKPMLISSRQLFVRTLCLLSVFMFFTSQGTFLSSDIAAANAVLISLIALTAYILDGFTYAAETLCGEQWGAKNMKLFKQACWRSSQLAFITAVAVSMTWWSGQSWIIAMFTDIPAVVVEINKYYFWLILLPCIAVWSYLLDGIFIGCGFTASMQNAMLCSTLIFYFPVWWLFQDLGNAALWMSFYCFIISRVLTLGVVLMTILYQPKFFHPTLKPHD